MAFAYCHTYWPLADIQPRARLEPRGGPPMVMGAFVELCLPAGELGGEEVEK